MSIKTKQQLRDYANTYRNKNGVQGLTGTTENVMWNDMIDSLVLIGEGGQLTKITESEGTGYILEEDNRTNKGSIGDNTVDLNKNAIHEEPYSDYLIYMKGANYEPLDSAPVYDEGNFWYDNVKKTFAMHNDAPDVELNLGETWVRVINKSGATILNGMVVRASGSDVETGLPTIELALADTYEHSFVIGMTTHDIISFGIGYVTTNGEVGGIDTTHLTAGNATYLSDKTPGHTVNAAPSIAALVGRCLSSNVDGSVFINTQNFLVFPGSVGILQDLNAKSILFNGGIPTILTGWTSESAITMIVDKADGVIQLPPVSGFYKVTITAQLAYLSESSTRTISFELYNKTLAVSVFNYIYNIPRDALGSSFSFTYPFVDSEANEYVVRALTENSETISFDKISFDISSSHLRQ